MGRVQRYVSYMEYVGHVSYIEYLPRQPVSCVFGVLVVAWQIDSWLVCDLLYLQHAFVQNCCGVISFLVLHLNLVTPVYVFIPVELRSVCIRYLL